MSVIYKYFIPFNDVVDVWMPAGAQILSVAEKDGELCLWAVVDPEAQHKELVTIRIIATGEEFDMKGLEFLGTVVIEPFVWHVFKVAESG